MKIQYYADPDLDPPKRLYPDLNPPKRVSFPATAPQLYGSTGMYQFLQSKNIIYNGTDFSKKKMFL